MKHPSIADEPELKTEELEWLTQKERCDQCNAQSYYRVTFESGNLFFCHHHYKRHEAVIFETALDVVDESQLLQSFVGFV